jgi:hypothetical protein
MQPQCQGPNPPSTTAIRLRVGSGIVAGVIEQSRIDRTAEDIKKTLMIS